MMTELKHNKSVAKMHPVNVILEYLNISQKFQVSNASGCETKSTIKQRETFTAEYNIIIQKTYYINVGVINWESNALCKGL